jgi:hypothetical protein
LSRQWEIQIINITLRKTGFVEVYVMTEMIFSDIEKADIVNRWISTFSSGVSEEILKEHVFKD